MREIIQKIIATESEAKLTVEAARVEADRVLSDAQKNGHEVVEQARQEVLIEAERIVEAAIETAERGKQHRLADAAVEIEKQIQLEPAIKKWAIEGVVQCVTK
jgi:cell division septum initiation protein DivIVA